MIRTGQQYLDSIRDNREVYINGERVKDVTRHPMLKPLGDRPSGDRAVQQWYAGPARMPGSPAAGLVGHGLGYSLLATKPANNMSYDGRALVTRPLASAAAASRLVLATRSGVPLSPAAHAFADQSFFGVSHAHPTT